MTSETCIADTCRGTAVARRRCVAHDRASWARLIDELAEGLPRIDLRGCSISQAHVNELCRGRNQLPELDLRGATMTGSVTLQDLSIERLRADELSARNLRVDRCRIAGEASFIGATLKRATLRNTLFERRASFVRVVSTMTFSLFECEFLEFVAFDGGSWATGGCKSTVFHDDASFAGLSVTRDLSLRGARFERLASLRDLRCAGTLTLTRADFDDHVVLAGSAIGGDVNADGTHFGDTRWLGPAKVAGKADLSHARFAEPVTLRLQSPHVVLQDATFDKGVDVDLSADASVDMRGAIAGAASSVTTTLTAPRKPGTLTDIREAKLSGLALNRLDLASCRFDGAHGLDTITLEGDQLPKAPRRRGTADREVVREEVEWRANRHWANPSYLGWEWKELHDQHPSSSAGIRYDGKGDARRIADIYRGLRRGRESAMNSPGGASFYYGEMEMRRHGADSLPERAVLTLYWAVSGYGLRALRPLAALATTLLAVSAALTVWGLNDPQPFGTVLLHTAESATVVPRPNAPLNLNDFGRILQLLLRLIGTTLLGLTLLAVRSRVKR